MVYGFSISQNESQLFTSKMTHFQVSLWAVLECSVVTPVGSIASESLRLQLLQELHLRLALTEGSLIKDGYELLLNRPQFCQIPLVSPSLRTPKEARKRNSYQFISGRRSQGDLSIGILSEMLKL